jgi:hypothetical protein
MACGILFTDEPSNDSPFFACSDRRVLFHRFYPTTIELMGGR